MHLESRFVQRLAKVRIETLKALHEFLGDVELANLNLKFSFSY